MTRAFLLAAGAAMALLAAGCARATRSEAPQLIVPPSPQGDGAPVAPAATRERAIPSPLIDLGLEDRAIAVLDGNLDDDVAEEQLVAVQLRDDPASPVRVLLVDADGRLARVVWEASTSATVARAVTLSLQDLVGDHGQQIVVTGMNEEGRFTLDVFRGSSALGDPAFYPICQIEADEILVQETNRTDAYAEGQRNGASFPVVAWLRDPASANPRDLVRVVWTWSYAEGRYVAGAEEKVPAERIGQAQLQQLFADLRPQAFESFLGGIWSVQTTVRAGQAAGSSPPADMLEFDQRSRRIAVISGGSLEVFLWRDTLRTLHDRVLILTENEAVGNVTRTFSVRAVDADGIVLTMRDATGGGTSDLAFSRLGPTSATTARTARAPAGEYLAANGLAVRFDEHTIAWTEGGRTRSGVWVLFPLDGRQLLTVRLIDGAAIDTRTWLAELTERRETSRVVRVLALVPVVVEAQGWSEGPGEALQLEQVEAIPKK